MAQKYDWVVLGRDENVTTINPSRREYGYGLINVSLGEIVKYGKRSTGINLVWADSEPPERHLRFWKKSGDTSPLKYGELFAIHIAGVSRWLVYQEGRKGVNLGWSDDPRFEWRFDHPLGGHSGETIEAGTQLGLYSMVVEDHLMYEPRDNGINLKWMKDSGRYDELTQLKGVLLEKVLAPLASLVGAKVGGPAGALISKEAAKILREKLA